MGRPRAASRRRRHPSARPRSPSRGHRPRPALRALSGHRGAGEGRAGDGRTRHGRTRKGRPRQGQGRTRQGRPAKGKDGAGKDVKPKAAPAPTAPPKPIIDEARTLSTTRAAAAWLATAVSLLILVLLIILILDNQQTVDVKYLGFSGSLPLGTALLIAAVAGGAIVTIVGVVRMTELRIMARRARRREAERAKKG